MSTGDATSFEVSGEAYDRFMGRYSGPLAAAFVDALGIEPGQRVLDVGCGPGALTGELVRRLGPTAVRAVDPSESFVAVCRTRNPGVDVARGRAEKLPYRNADFDAALAQLVLHFVTDPEATAAEMRRIVRPGGIVAAAVWDFRGGLVFQRLFWDTAAGLDAAAGAARDRLFSSPLALPDGLPILWREAGLNEIERGSITIRMEYADFADYWKPLRGGQGPVGAYVESLSPEQRRLIEERVRLSYLSGAPDGPRSMTATAWAVRGTVS